jgi:hypothetical protein
MAKYDDDDDTKKMRLRELLKKAVAVNSQPTEDSFPELPDILFWLRAMIGVAYGYYLGHIKARNGVMLLHTLNLIGMIPILYCRFYLGTQPDQYGGLKLFWSGLVPGIALCLLVWIYVFTATHEREEELLNSLLVVKDDASSGASDVHEQTPEPAEEPEF